MSDLIGNNTEVWGNQTNLVTQVEGSTETHQKKPADAMIPGHVPEKYVYERTEEELMQDVQNFLNAFAKDSSVYALVDTLNNSLKSLVREMRESEASLRIKKYIEQFDIALEKRDAILETADEVKELKIEAADRKMAMGIAKGALSLGGSSGGGSGGEGGSSGLGGLSNIGFAIGQNKVDHLNISADDAQMRLRALEEELNAKANFARQEGDLANSQISFLDSLSSTFSSLTKDLYSSTNSTFKSMV